MHLGDVLAQRHVADRRPVGRRPGRIVLEGELRGLAQALHVDDVQRRRPAGEGDRVGHGPQDTRVSLTGAHRGGDRLDRLDAGEHLRGVAASGTRVRRRGRARAASPGRRRRGSPARRPRRPRRRSRRLVAGLDEVALVDGSARRRGRTRSPRRPARRSRPPARTPPRRTRRGSRRPRRAAWRPGSRSRAACRSVAPSTMRSTSSLISSGAHVGERVEGALERVPVDDARGGLVEGDDLVAGRRRARSAAPARAGRRRGCPPDRRCGGRAPPRSRRGRRRGRRRAARPGRGARGGRGRRRRRSPSGPCPATTRISPSGVTRRSWRRSAAPCRGCRRGRRRAP